MSRRRPTQVTTAVVLLVVASVLWLLLIGQFGTPTTGLAVALPVLVVVFAARSGGGSKGARTVVTVVVLLLRLFVLPYTWLGFGDPNDLYGPENAVLDVVAVLMSAVGVVLLYLLAANAHIRTATARRDQ